MARFKTGQFNEDDITQYVNQAKKLGASDEDISAGLREDFGIDMGGQTQQTAQPQSKSLGGFLSNVGTDVGQNVQGLTQLPGLLLSILQGQTDLGETAGNVAKGVVGEYKDLITNPLETGYNKPVTTLLNVLPFLGPAKSLLTKLGVAGKAADTATDVGRMAKYGKTGELFAKLPDELQDVTTGARAATKAKNFGEALTQSGEGLRRGVAGFSGSSGTRWFKDAQDFADFQRVTGLAGAPEKQLSQVGIIAEAANKQIEKLLPTVKAKPRYTNIIGSLNKQLTDYALDLDNPIVRKAITAEKQVVKSLIEKTPSAQAIYDYKTQLGNQLRKAKAFGSGVTAEKVMVKKAMYDGLKDVIDSLDSRVRPINAYQYKLSSYADDLLSQVGKGGMGGRLMAGGAATTIPNLIPSGPIRQAEDALGRGLIKAGENPLVNTGANTISKILGTPNKTSMATSLGRNMMGGAGGEEEQPMPTSDGEQMIQELLGSQAEAKDTTDTTKQPNKKDMFAAMIMADMAQTGGKNTSQIKTLMDIMAPEEKEEKKLSGAVAKDLSRNKTALKDIVSMEKILFKKDGSGQVIASALPGAFGARKYRALWGGIVDAIGTNRTGAAYTPAQREDYMFLLPAPGDTAEEVKFKMNRIKGEISEYIGNLTSTDANSDAIEMLNQVLGQQ